MYAKNYNNFTVYSSKEEYKKELELAIVTNKKRIKNFNYIYRSNETLDFKNLNKIQASI